MHSLIRKLIDNSIRAISETGNPCKLSKIRKAKTMFCAGMTFLITSSLIILIFSSSQAIAEEQQNSLSFSLGVPGKTGCLVCHGDSKILQKKSQNEGRSGLYISDKVMANSVHKDIACTSCHSDFKLLTATKDHKAKTLDYKTVAGLSCKNCHRHSKQLIEYSQSIHGKLALSRDPKKGATCADCHGSHDIRSIKKDKEYEEQFHLSGIKTCGRCHEKYVDSYNDYYHGKAYNQKALDAPACWDCHGAHNIQRADNPDSDTEAAKLAKACGKCHVDSRAEFAMQYGKMIHNSRGVIAQNIVSGNASKAWLWVQENIFNKIGDYYTSITTSLFSRDQR
jgi:hypothetical protein